MASAVSAHSLHRVSGSFSSNECCERFSSLGARKSANFGFDDVRSVEWRIKGLVKEVKLQALTSLAMGGLRVKERDIQVGRISCHRKVRTCALQEKYSILSALVSTDDSSVDQSGNPQDANSVNAEEMELNYMTVREIVENLQDAPFLQYVYNANQGGKPTRHRLSTEFFDKPETWGPVRECLLEAAPDRIIMVHRLDRNDPSECCLIEKSGEKAGAQLARGDQGVSGKLDDYWGLLVHGCKARCNACYLLRTTRQPSPNGFTTYFMLIRAECFGPSIENQFKRAALV